MQANTVGDQYACSLTDSTGATQLSLTGVSNAEVAIAGPFASRSLAVEAGAMSGVTMNASLQMSPPVVSWTTAVAGILSQAVTTYPSGGWYAHQVILNYTNGDVAKSRLFVLQIMDSIA